MFIKKTSSSGFILFTQLVDKACGIFNIVIWTQRERYVTLVFKLSSGTHTGLASMLNAIRSRLYILRGKINQYSFVLFPPS